jgi:phosphate:Na+ symporter
MEGLAGLGLFLFGISLLEEGLKTLAGRPFKLFMRKHTDRPLKAILAGLLATAVLQSSSVVTLLLLALVGAGIIELTSALGIVIGANLGTTFTGWVVTVVGFKADIEAWVMPLVAAGALLYVFTRGRYSRLASWGQALLGFGLLLLGLVMLKDAMSGLAEQVDLVAYARYGTVPFALAGFVFTAIIQSSSATMVITLAALNSGVLELQSAAALVIGADLGTTTTAILGGLGGTAVKKQVALGQFLFNLVTDLTALAVLPWLLHGVSWLVGADPLLALVAFHSSFNVLGILLFLPFLGAFARFLQQRIHGADDLPAGFEGLADLDPRFPAAAVLVIEHATRNFLLKTCALNRHSMRVVGPEPGLRAQVVGERAFLDRYAEYKQLQGQIIQALLKVQQARLGAELADEFRSLQRCLQNAGHSAKELRDVERDFRAMESAADPRSQTRMAALQELPRNSYEQLEALLGPTPPAERESSPESAVFTALCGLLDQNRVAYEQRLAGIYGEAAAKLAPEQLTEALHVNREVYVSTKRLIIAFRDALLCGEAADRFDRLPAR